MDIEVISVLSKAENDQLYVYGSPGGMQYIHQVVLNVQISDHSDLTFQHAMQPRYPIVWIFKKAFVNGDKKEC